MKEGRKKERKKEKGFSTFFTARLFPQPLLTGKNLLANFEGIRVIRHQEIWIVGGPSH